MQLEWANQVNKFTRRACVNHVPISNAAQTIEER